MTEMTATEASRQPKSILTVFSLLNIFIARNRTTEYASSTKAPSNLSRKPKKATCRYSEKTADSRTRRLYAPRGM